MPNYGKQRRRLQSLLTGKLIGAMFMAHAPPPANIEDVRGVISPQYVLEVRPMVIEIRSTPSLATLIEAMLAGAIERTKLEKPHGGVVTISLFPRQQLWHGE